jgi:predicted amidohydrolase
MPKIATIQMCSSPNVDENLASAAQLITEAAAKGAKLVVLPEMFAVMGATNFDKVAVQEEFGEGKIQNFLSEQAMLNQIWIVGGTIPIKSSNPHKVRAACLVYDDQGNYIVRYDKAHLFDAYFSEKASYQESETTEAGDELIVIQTPFGKLGLAVCYDLRFSELFLGLFKKGAEIIAVPTAFVEETGSDHWHVLMRGRALENFAYIAGSCQFGMHASDRQTYGHAMIVDPWGKIVDEVTTPTHGIAYCDVDLEYLHEKRKCIPVAAHSKKF